MTAQTLSAAAAALVLCTISFGQIRLTSAGFNESELREGEPADFVVGWRSSTGQSASGTITFESSDPALFRAPAPVQVSGLQGAVRRVIPAARLTGIVGASVTLTGLTDAPAPGDRRAATVVVRPVHDHCGSFAPAPILSGQTLEGSIAHATPDGVTSCVTGTEPPDVWHRFTAPGNGTLTLTTCGTHDRLGVDTGMDTVLSVRGDECPQSGNCVDNTPCPAEPGGSMGDAGQNRDATLVRVMRAGEEIVVRIAAATGRMADGAYVLTADFDLEGDDCEGAVSLLDQQALQAFGTSIATTDGPPACGGLEKDVWFTYTATRNGRVHLNTDGSGFDTVLAAYEGGACPPSLSALLACDDDSGAGDASRLAVRVAPGQSLLVQVGGRDGGPGGGGLARLQFSFERLFCPCNLGDDNFIVDVLDLLTYLNRWFAGSDFAEFDGVPGVDVFDLLAFLDCWFPASAGQLCPAG